MICGRLGVHIIKRKKLLSFSNSSFLFLSCSSFHHHISANHHPIIIINKNIVETNLRNSPCDLYALSYFLWCARQPHFFHDKLTIRNMLPVLSNLTHQYKTVKAILNQLESIGCLTQPKTFLLFIRIYSCRSDLYYNMISDSLEQMLKHGYSPNTYFLNILIDVHFKNNHVLTALRLFSHMNSPNFLTFNIAVSNLCRLNDLINLTPVLRRMFSNRFYMDPHTYLKVLTCFCRFRRVNEALQLLAIMVVSGQTISVNVWTILIHGFCKTRRIKDAECFFEKMVDIGCSPNIVTWTSLIKGFLEFGMLNKAIHIFNTMESSKGCSPDLILCNVLIDCLSKMGLYKDAFEVFSSLRQRNLVPDVYTFSSLLSTMCLSRHYVLQPLLTSGLAAVKPDLVLCNSLITYYCKSGHPQCAVNFYDDVIASKFQPDKYSFAGVLTALCRSGQINTAFHVYHGMIHSHKPDIDAHIHTIMVNGLMRSGSLNKAITLFKKATAERYRLDVTSYNAVIKGLLRGGRTDEAYALFSQMKHSIDTTPNEHTYNLILFGYCKNRDFNMVKCILQEMVGRNVELEYKTYKLIANFLENSPHSLLDFNLLSELVDRHDTTGASVAAPDHRYNVPEIGASSSDDLSDDVVSVG